MSKKHDYGFTLVTPLVDGWTGEPRGYMKGMTFWGAKPPEESFEPRESRRPDDIVVMCL